MDEEIASSGPTQPRKRSKKASSAADSSDDPYDFETTGSGSQTAAELSTLKGKRSKKGSQSAGDVTRTQDTTAAETTAMETIEESGEGGGGEGEEAPSISEERFDVFKKSLTQLFRESRAQSIPMARFRDYLGQQHGAQPFRQHETAAAFQRMTDANQIMVADDIIFLI